MLGYTLSHWLFGILAFMSIMFACMVVASKNPINSVLYLVLTFFTIAGHYLLLQAQFLAIVHIVVYAGAIMVLFLFVLMLMNLNEDAERHRTGLQRIGFAVLGGSLFIVLLGALKGATLEVANPNLDPNIGLVKTLGTELFTTFLFPFEIVSVLLLAALVGVILIGKKRTRIEETTPIR